MNRTYPPTRPSAKTRRCTGEALAMLLQGGRATATVRHPQRPPHDDPGLLRIAAAARIGKTRVLTFLAR